MDAGSKIFGHDWSSIQRAQAGGNLSRPAIQSTDDFPAALNTGRTEMHTSAFDIARGARIEPKDAYTAFNVLGRRERTLKEGVVVGHAGRGGDYLLVEWDGFTSCVPDIVHWMNVKSVAA